MRLFKRATATTVNALTAVDDTVNTVSKLANAAYVGASSLVIAAEAGEFALLEMAVDSTRDKVKKLEKRVRKLEAKESPKSESDTKAIASITALIAELIDIENANTLKLVRLRTKALDAKLDDKE